MAQRVVLDTDTLVAALRSRRGASRVLLVAALDRAFTTLISVPLILEYEAVLTRPEHLAASGVSAADVATVLDALASIATPVRVAFLWRPSLPDADDDMVLETAVNGRAHIIVTLNRRHFVSVAKRFGIEVLSPGQLVERLRVGQS